jgi:hypothetical protein
MDNIRPSTLSLTTRRKGKTRMSPESCHPDRLQAGGSILLPVLNNIVLRVRVTHGTFRVRCIIRYYGRLHQNVHMV